MIQVLCISVTILHIILSLYRQNILDIHIAILTLLLCVQRNCVFIQFLYTVTSPSPALGCFCSFRKWRWELEHLLQRYIGGGCEKNFPEHPVQALIKWKFILLITGLIFNFKTDQLFFHIIWLKAKKSLNKKWLLYHNYLIEC